MLRPIGLAREHGLSPQAIRNYDDAGILPPAERGQTGYRRHTPLHAQALWNFLALRGGHGHQQAMEIVRATNRGDTESAWQETTRRPVRCSSAEGGPVRTRASPGSPPASAEAGAVAPRAAVDSTS